MSALAQLVIALVIFAAGGAAGIKWHAGQDAKKELEHVQRHAEEARESTRMERARSANVITAQSEATRRLAALRADATAARDAVDGLRDATTAVLKHADTSLGACAQSAAALGAVFNACSKEYQGLAEAADGHAADALMLERAWPDNSGR